MSLRFVDRRIQLVIYDFRLLFGLLVLWLLFVRGNWVALNGTFLLLRLKGLFVWIRSLLLIRFAESFVDHIGQDITVYFLTSVVESFDMVVGQSSQVLEFRITVQWLIQVLLLAGLLLFADGRFFPLSVSVKARSNAGERLYRFITIWDLLCFWGFLELLLWNLRFFGLGLLDLGLISWGFLVVVRAVVS